MVEDLGRKHSLGIVLPPCRPCIVWALVMTSQGLVEAAAWATLHPQKQIPPAQDYDGPRVRQWKHMYANAIMNQISA